MECFHLFVIPRVLLRDRCDIPSGEETTKTEGLTRINNTPEKAGKNERKQRQNEFIMNALKSISSRGRIRVRYIFFSEKIHFSRSDLLPLVTEPSLRFLFKTKEVDATFFNWNFLFSNFLGNIFSIEIISSEF